MVNTTQIELVEKVRFYVTNKNYPSIHVYTVDEELAEYLCRVFNARNVPHRGTTDYAITKREDLLAIAKLVYERGSSKQKPVAATLIRYCSCTDTEQRHKIAKRLKRQIALLR